MLFLHLTTKNLFQFFNTVVDLIILTTNLLKNPKGKYLNVNLLFVSCVNLFFCFLNFFLKKKIKYKNDFFFLLWIKNFA